MKRPARVPSQLPESLRRRLNAYALAASAAGVGMLASVQPAEARIVYTPAHIKVGGHVGHSVPLDLNHDGQVDFKFGDFPMCTTRCENGFVGLWVYPAATANQIWATFPHFFGASALPAGVVVGSKGKFVSWDAEWMAGFYYNFYTNGTHVQSIGPWRDVKDRYLGLKFVAKDGSHYGWARLNVRCEKSALGTRKELRTLGVLTGYAYETIPNKPIIAGHTHGRDEATLGHLATGASAIPAWRVKRTAATSH
jgi:hypothetical protein